MTAGADNHLISVHPDELKFLIEQDKPSYCDLKVSNNTSHNVAFKVKTTSPKKYFVRPNTGVLQPWDACVIRVTLQAQREHQQDMQCKDKFLLQSVKVSAESDVDDLPADTFTKENSENSVEECKLRVVYAFPSQPNGIFDGEQGTSQSADLLQQLKEERDAAMRSTQQLHRELDVMKRRRYRERDSGYTVTCAFVVGVVGVLAGFVLNLILSSRSSK